MPLQIFDSRRPIIRERFGFTDQGPSVPQRSALLMGVDEYDDRFKK